MYINHELNTTIPFIVFLLQNVPKYVRHEENVCSFITITKWILIYIFLDPFMPLYRFCLPTTWYTCKVINVHKFFHTLYIASIYICQYSIILTFYIYRKENMLAAFTLFFLHFQLLHIIISHLIYWCNIFHYHFSTRTTIKT